MKHYLLLFLLVFITALAQAQQGLPILVTSTTAGKIYEINTENCSGRLICTTNKDFNDIAFTPNGKLWGRTIDSLFWIDTTTGSVFAIGRATIGNGLVGLNDSILLIDSSRYLFRIKNTDASKQVIGDMGYPLHGDYTWVGKYLYASAYATGGLIRITLDSTYSQIQSIDTIADINDIYTYVTPALASIKADSTHYNLIAFPGNVDYFEINPETGSYQLLCSGSVVSTAGAASMLFPPLPQRSTAIQEHQKENLKLVVYPNPAKDKLFISSAKALDGYTFSIVETTGNILYQKKGSGIITQLDVSGFSAGIYFIQIKDSDGRILEVIKVLKP